MTAGRGPLAAEPRIPGLGVALFAAAVVVAGAPFIGELRGAVLAAFPAHYRLIIGGVVIGSTATLVLAALARIRDRRASRYAMVAAALCLGAAIAVAFRTGDPNVDVVEAFHFVEYAVVTALFYRVWRSNGDASTIVFPALAALAVGVVDEWVQWFVPGRAGEIRDVALNAVAAGCGMLLSLAAAPPRSLARALGPGDRARLGGSTAVLVMLVAAFFSTVHLGHDLSDPEIGVFRSRESVAGLAEISRNRLERWRDRAPVAAPRIGREDQYLSEALWHVRRRNEAVSHGEADIAWRENRILEKFYAPVLDTPSDAGAAGHRWPPEQRATMALRAGSGAISFVSDASPYPIYTWSKRAFWVAASTGALLIVALSVWADRRVGNPVERGRST